MCAGPALLATQRKDGRSPFRVISLDFGSSDGEKIRMATSVAFTNDSSTSVSSLGHVEFEMSYEGVPLGRMRSEVPLRMARGSNVYTFQGELRPLQLALTQTESTQQTEEAQQHTQIFLDTLGSMMAKSLSGLPVVMDARGVDCSEPVFLPAVLASAFITPVQGLSVAARDGAAKEVSAGILSEAPNAAARPKRAPQPRGDSPLTAMVEALRLSDDCKPSWTELPSHRRSGATNKA
ncbi:hypothetical protein cyc_08219 [Cyclospora cayetanensis]|uniref:Uncharacterized protein n=1 Tax=Cyclospora cayetanensis TaxID=88456 RepID=A0A1D3D1W6_9EIME|nr:hypothetical protein cyc_08219 [Cyclospora cayetanensis]